MASSNNGKAREIPSPPAGERVRVRGRPPPYGKLKLVLSRLRNVVVLIVVLVACPMAQAVASPRVGSRMRRENTWTSAKTLVRILVGRPRR